MFNDKNRERFAKFRKIDIKFNVDAATAATITQMKAAHSELIQTEYNKYRVLIHDARDCYLRYKCELTKLSAVKTDMEANMLNKFKEEPNLAQLRLAKLTPLLELTHMNEHSRTFINDLDRTYEEDKARRKQEAKKMTESKGHRKI